MQRRHHHALSAVRLAHGETSLASIKRPAERRANDQVDTLQQLFGLDSVAQTGALTNATTTQRGINKPWIHNAAAQVAVAE